MISAAAPGASIASTEIATDGWSETKSAMPLAIVIARRMGSATTTGRLMIRLRAATRADERPGLRC